MHDGTKYLNIKTICEYRKLNSIRLATDQMNSLFAISNMPVRGKGGFSICGGTQTNNFFFFLNNEISINCNIISNLLYLCIFLSFYFVCKSLIKVVHVNHILKETLCETDCVFHPGMKTGQRERAQRSVRFFFPQRAHIHER